MNRIGELTAKQQLVGLLESPDQKVREAAACVLFWAAPSPDTFKGCYDLLKERTPPSEKDEQALLTAAGEEDWQKVKHLFKEGACGYSLSESFEK